MGKSLSTHKCIYQRRSGTDYDMQYGLQTAFSEIERKSHSVTSAGNPISMDLTTRYKVKGVGKETTINSKINIFTDGGKIQRVEDKWDGKLPDSSITNVCNRWSNAVSPFFWTHYAFGWFYSAVVLLHETPLARVRGLRGFLAELLLHALICQYCLHVIFAGPHADPFITGLPQTERRLRPENGRRAQQCRRRRQARQLAAAQEQSRTHVGGAGTPEARSLSPIARERQAQGHLEEPPGAASRIVPSSRFGSRAQPSRVRGVEQR